MKKLILIYIMISSIMFFPISVLAEEYAIDTTRTKKVTLEKCVDGDTANFKDITGRVYKTRFLAIDTRETVHPSKPAEAYGKEASTFTCESLTGATEIILETDPASDEEDKYGRLLAWVFVDGTLLQESLIERGLAEVAYLYGDYKYTARLETVQKMAKENKVGFWSEETEKVEKVSSKTKKKKEEKTFVQKLVDQLLAKVFDYIENLLDKIASWIENVLY